MSDSKRHQELIQLAHQLFLLISTRPAFIPRLNDQQSSAITWVIKNFDQPHIKTQTEPSLSLSSVETKTSNIVVPLAWLNSYDRALKAADRVLAGLPVLQILVNSTISRSPNSIELEKAMPESTPQLETSQRVDGVVTMTAEQINQFVISIMQNVNQGKTQNQNQIRAQDIGYFEPDVNAEEPVETVNGSTVYHNVFSFTARIKAKVSRSENSPWSSTNLAQKLDQCLKGKAELWYTNEINDTTRAGLQAGHELWCSELEARFRMPPGEALRELHAPKYGIEEVRARQDPETFVQKVVLYGMASGTATTVYSQLLFAHQLLDGRLRLNVSPPSESTTLTSFIQSLTAIKATWFDIWLPQRAVAKTQRSINSPFYGSHPREFANKSKFSHPHSSRTFEPNKIGKNIEFKSEQLNHNKPLLRDRYEKRAEHQQEEFKRNYVNKGRHNFSKPSNQHSANAYGAEADTLGIDEENRDESIVEEQDPYDDAYFEGIKEDVTDEEDGQESKPVNYYSVIRNFSVNPINPNDGHQSQDMIKRRLCKNAVTSKIAHEYSKNSPHSLKPHNSNLDESRTKNPKYRICSCNFTSGNKFHAHLKQNHYSNKNATKRASSALKPNEPYSTKLSTALRSPKLKSRVSSYENQIVKPSVTVITSTVRKSAAHPGEAFRGRRFAQLRISLVSPQNEEISVCLDTGCTMSLIHR